MKSLLRCAAAGVAALLMAGGPVGEALAQVAMPSPPPIYNSSAAAYAR